MAFTTIYFSPTGKEIIELPVEDRNHRIERTKLFLAAPPLNFPVSGHFNYRSNRKMAICVPIFLNTKNPTPKKAQRGYYSICGYIKRAFWQSYELSKYGRLAETETDFYIITHKELLSIIEPYRALCGFPEENILTFEGTQDYLGYMPNVYLLNEFCQWADRSGLNYDRFIRLDASVHFPQETPLLQDVMDHWSDFPEHILLPSEPWRHSEKIVLPSEI